MCDEAKDCAPCRDCDYPPDPILPRCDIALIDGRYDNATIVVEQGCIVGVETGRVPQYTPEVCCSGGGGGGGGGGGEGPPGPKGDPGENATLDIGTVTTLAPKAKAYVRNVGSATNAILDIGLPQGEQGEPGINPMGITKSVAGIDIENGSVTGLPVTWPPVLLVMGEADTLLVDFDFSFPDKETGIVKATLNLAKLNEDINKRISEAIEEAIEPIQAQLNDAVLRIQTLENTVADHERRIKTLESKSSSSNS